MTGRTVTLEIPLPPRGCSPNMASSRHWRGRHSCSRAYRQETFYLLKAAGASAMRAPVTISAVFYCATVRGDGRYRPRDIANGIASLKAACDAITDAGVIPDDSARYLHWGRVDIVGAKESAGRACVVVELREETRDDGCGP